MSVKPAKSALPDTGIGARMHGWATDLFPICRSLTGPGVRETLAYLKTLMPGLTMHSVPTGTQAFDWTVPDEWTIRDAYIADESGKRIVDFKQHNLHVVGYSEPVDRWLDLEELKPHLYSLPDQPNAIPYITSYYKRRWGFCLTHNQLKTLKPGKYHAVVDSDLKPGVLNYAELILPGKSEKEILLSTYVCHPSMANNELSGPVVTTALAQYLMAKKDRRYTYRIIFVPETIGAVVYLSKNLEAMKRNTVAGYVVTCCGDDRAYSYLESRLGNTRADHTARQVLKRMHPEYVTYPFIDCGSDERQYCSPRIDLPAASVMRTRYGIYPEYHTSLDDLSLVTPAGLEGAYDVMCNILDALENSRVYRLTNFAEPQLGKRGLYPALSTKSSVLEVQNMINLMNYADGNHDLVAIAERIGADINECAQIAEKLHKAGLLEVVD